MLRCRTMRSMNAVTLFESREEFEPRTFVLSFAALLALFSLIVAMPIGSAAASVLSVGFFPIGSRLWRALGRRCQRALPSVAAVLFGAVLFLVGTFYREPTYGQYLMLLGIALLFAVVQRWLLPAQRRMGWVVQLALVWSLIVTALLQSSRTGQDEGSSLLVVTAFLASLLIYGRRL